MSKPDQKQSSSTSWFSLALAFFKIGLTAYGMAILQQIKALIIGRKWLTQKELDEGLAMVQLYPGPIMFNLATYGAYRIKGFLGALIATFMFVLPSYMLMVFLSWTYFNYGNITWVHPLFISLEAMVIGIVIHIFIDFAGRYLTEAKTATLASVAFLLLLYKFNAFLVVLLSILLSLILFWKQDSKSITKNKQSESLKMIPGSFKKRLTGIFSVGLIFLVIILISFLSNSKNAELLISMFKVGAVAFGNGFTIMPLLQQEAVNNHHWLTLKEFADGIAFGQITQGPFLITATFIGFKVNGFVGSLIATFGMFFPSFFYTLVISEIYSKIRNYTFIRMALKGILAAFTGMLLFVVLSLGKISLTQPATYIWTLGALLLVRYFKINILWIFLIGLITSLLLNNWGIIIL